MTVRVRMILIFVVLFLSLSSQAEAREWTIVGPRALGMGGAHVAVANDATASYWNPAAYGLFRSEIGGDYGCRKSSVVLDTGAGVQDHEDFGERLESISKYSFDALDTGQISSNRVADFLQLINELKVFDESENTAVMVLGNFGPWIQVGHFGIGGYVFGEVSARDSIDLVNIAPVTAGTTNVNVIEQLSTYENLGAADIDTETDYYLSSDEKSGLITTIGAMDGWETDTAANFVQAVDYGLDQSQQSGVVIPSDITATITHVAQVASNAQTGGSFADNDSKLLFKGIAVGEFPLTYGHAVSEDFAVGGNIKFMKARVYNTFVDVFDTDFEDALDRALDVYEESQNFGVDLGLLYRFGDDLRVGLVGRNLNRPEFDMKPRFSGDDDTIKEKAQVRAGAAYKPVDYIMLALDIDLTKNDTSISSNYESQNIGGGLEFKAHDMVRLRAGAYKNMAENDIGLVYTAGFGIRYMRFSLDAGASMTSESSTIDGNSVPKEFRSDVAISVLF